MTEPLESYLWKNRVLLLSFGEKRTELLAELKKEKIALKERDLVLIDLFPIPTEHPLLTRLPEKEAVELRQRYALNKQATSVLLIGKDGGLKARQSTQLDLFGLFARIDAMPMRQAEMKAGSVQDS